MLSWELKVSFEINKCIFIVDMSKIFNENTCAPFAQASYFVHFARLHTFKIRLCVAGGQCCDYLVRNVS